ncbi:hypothetical protein HDV01_006167, partial [Terramyces sp. JEL0728]
MKSEAEIELELNNLNLSLSNEKYQIIHQQWISDCTADLTNQILHTDLSEIIDKADIINQQLFDIIDIKEIGISVQNQKESFLDPNHKTFKKQLLLTLSNGIVQIQALEMNDIGLNVLSRGKILVQGHYRRMFIIQSGTYLGDWSISPKEYIQLLDGIASENIDQPVAAPTSSERDFQYQQEPKMDYSDDGYFMDDLDNYEFAFDQMNSMTTKVDYTTIKPTKSTLESHGGSISHKSEYRDTRQRENIYMPKQESPDYFDSDFHHDLIDIVDDKEN